MLVWASLCFPPLDTTYVRAVTAVTEWWNRQSKSFYRLQHTHTQTCSSCSTPPLLLERLDWQAKAGLPDATCSILHNDLCVFYHTTQDQWSASVEGDSYVCVNVGYRVELHRAGVHCWLGCFLVVVIVCFLLSKEVSRLQPVSLLLFVSSAQN